MVVYVLDHSSVLELTQDFRLKISQQCVYRLLILLKLSVREASVAHESLYLGWINNECASEIGAKTTVAHAN